MTRRSLKSGKGRTVQSDLICPWCETHPLRYYDVSHDAPNGPGSATLAGVKLACSNPGDQNCPDTTGACATAEEAYGYALELAAQPQDKQS